MVGAGDIVADHFRRQPAEEDRARMRDPGGQPLAVLDRDLQVFRRDPVRQRRRLREVVDRDDRPVPVPALPRNLDARQLLQLALDRRVT